MIAAAVQMTGECRSLDRERVEALKAEMDATMRRAASDSGGSVEIAWTLEYEGFELAEDDDLVRIVSTPVVTWGSSRDVRYRRRQRRQRDRGHGRPGARAVVRDAGCAFGTDESVAVADLENLTELVTAIAWRLAE